MINNVPILSKNCFGKAKKLNLRKYLWNIDVSPFIFISIFYLLYVLCYWIIKIRERLKMCTFLKGKNKKSSGHIGVDNSPLWYRIAFAKFWKIGQVFFTSLFNDEMKHILWSIIWSILATTLILCLWKIKLLVALNALI